MAEDGGSSQGGATALRALRPFADLPVETLDALERSGRTRRYHAGQVVAEAGEEPRFVGCVFDGILRMQKTQNEGRQHIVGLLVEGDLFGRVFDGPMNMAVEAATDARIVAFRRAEFEDLLLHSQELERAVILTMLNELDRARDWMVILANPRVRGRLAAFLLALCIRFASADHLLRPGRATLQVKIPISRPDLAHLLGTRTESISRAFHMLADAGYIAILRPDLIDILDIKALGTEAGDDDVVRHPTVQALLQGLNRDGC